MAKSVIFYGFWMVFFLIFAGFDRFLNEYRSLCFLGNVQVFEVQIRWGNGTSDIAGKKIIFYLTIGLHV